MRRLLALCCLALLTWPAQAQVWKLPERVIQRLIPDDSAEPTNARPRLLAYPTIAFAPETSLELGISSLLVFSAHNNLVRNRLSEITALVFYTLNRQYGLWSDHAIYTDLDKFYFLGRYRIQSFPLLVYGVGQQASKERKFVVDGNYLLIHQRAMVRLAPNLFTGPMLDYQRLFNVRLNDLEPEDTLKSRPGRGLLGSSNFGLGATLIYDDRHNYLNVRRGSFAEVSVLRYASALGSDFSFSSFIVDTRRFWHGLAPKQTIATQLYYQGIVDGSAPFNMLGLMGNEALMRGYYTGRYRDNHYLAGQAEYRFLPFPFSKRLGGAVFAAAGAVAPRFADLAQARYRLAAGGGLRYLILSSRDIYIRADLGFTAEGQGLYIFLGEAF